MRNEQRAYGEKRSQAQNTRYADDEKGIAVYRLRKGETRQPEYVANYNETVVSESPLPRAKTYFHQQVQRERCFGRSRQYLGWTFVEWNDYDYRLHALLGRVSIARNGKS